MFTTGFKLFFGFFIAALGAAFIYGYASGGTHIGPLTLGYKGGVGSHLGYGVLVGLATVSLVLSLLTVSFRDADASAAASLLGTANAPVGQRPVSDSMWPILSAFAVGVAIIGLVVHPWLFIAGAALLVMVAFEWTVSAWADRATGDAELNRDLRNGLMRPVEVPTLATIIIGVLVLAFSRIFLAASPTGAVVAASIIGVVILAGAVGLSFRPKVSKNVLAGVLVLGAVGILAGGIVSAAIGEREFHNEFEQHEEGDTVHAEEPAGEAGEPAAAHSAEEPTE